MSYELFKFHIIFHLQTNIHADDKLFINIHRQLPTYHFDYVQVKTINIVREASFHICLHSKVLVFSLLLIFCFITWI